MQVSHEQRDKVALITIDDGKKNAITLDALRELDQAFDVAEQEAGAIVLAGRPGAFCAGFDLAVMTGTDRDAIATLGRTGGRFAQRLYGCKKPLVAACTGHAFTIGALWLLACDTRIGERGAYKFCMIETKMGMGLGPWAMVLLQGRIPPSHFVPAVTQSKSYDPEGAVAAGFLDELVEPGEAVEAAVARAAELAELPAAAYAMNKLSVREDGLATMAADLA